MKTAELRKWVDSLVAEVEASDTLVREARVAYEEASVEYRRLRHFLVVSCVGSFDGPWEQTLRDNKEAKDKAQRASEEAWDSYTYARLTSQGRASGIRRAMETMQCLSLVEPNAFEIIQGGLDRLEVVATTISTGPSST